MYELMIINAHKDLWKGEGFHFS